jgi:hypothetical protein
MKSVSKKLLSPIGSGKHALLGDINILVRGSLEASLLTKFLGLQCIEQHHEFLLDDFPRIMSTSREGPNPLRPYYRPPSIGIPQDTPGTTSSGTHGLGPKNGSAASYASSARDMFDYSEYLSDSSPSSVEAVKKTLDDWFYKYFSIILSQPFDVAKTVLQVRHQGLADGAIPAAASEEGRTQSSSYRNSMYSDVGCLQCL